MSRRLIVEADGGSRGNPGPAGYGAVVRDAETKEVLAEVAGGIGTATNNEAEYRGLIEGLRAARTFEPSSIEVRLDSKLVVEQMSSRWKVKHPRIRELAGEAAELLRQLPEVSFTHVRRELNEHADRLANEAMDDAAAGREWARRVEATPAPNRLSGWMSAPAPPMVMLLLRHGATEMSVDRRFSGHGDVALSEAGEQQARAAAKRIAARADQLDAIIASPLRRAQQTAQAVADEVGAGVLVVTEPGYAETDFGEWEGHTFAEVKERWPAELQRWLSDPSFPPPGGESFAVTDARVRAARDKIAVEYAEKTVLVVSHVTPIKLLLRLALEAPITALYRLHLDVASLSEIDWYADGPAVVRRLNDTAHLDMSL